jgi:DNA-binding LytR/AlgR family response regulator
LVFLPLGDVWACEAADRLTFVHSSRGRFDLDLSLSAIESSFGRALHRVHRNWLANLENVTEFDRQGREATLLLGTRVPQGGAPLLVPVARDRVQEVRDFLFRNAAGVRGS